jgi:hypothetical protein
LKPSRRHFISVTALGISAVALTGSESAQAADSTKTPLRFPILGPDQYDRAGMQKTLANDNENKQVFLATSPATIVPGVASLYLHMQNSMNAFEFSYAKGPGSLATLGVLLGPAIALGLNDAMWTKYKFGSTFNLAPTNIYYTASSNLTPSGSPDDPNGLYQDWSAQAILKRGGAFMICHNATSAVAGMIAGKASLNPKSVLADFEKNLLPGFQFVPAGVAAIQNAQEKGWELFPII